MRILMVTLNARLLGGLETCSRDVALSLQRLGHDLSVVSALECPQTFPGWGNTRIRAIAPANPVLMRLYFRVWRWALALHLHKVRHRYDLVLIMHSYAAVCAHWAGISRYWVWTYGIEVWGKWASWLRIGLENAQSIAAISSDTAKAVENRLGKQPVIVSPVVDTTRFVPAKPPRVPEPPYRLLTVGRLIAEECSKGHELVIRNLRPITERIGAPVEYLIAGDGEDRSRLENTARANHVSDEVHFLGAVPADQLVATYQACDVFVMPSSREGFGIVYLEASACGKPVVGSNVGGAVDAIQDGVTGFCVDPKSDQAIVEATVKLLANRDLMMRMGQAGRERVEREFSLQALDRHFSTLLDHS